MSYKLLGVMTDAKTSKGAKFGYLTGICYLAPAEEAGGRNMCPFSSAGCRAVCLFSAGRGAFTNVREARIRKTRWWFTDPAGFKRQLSEDIRRLKVEAESKGLIPAVRCNGTSDHPWEKEGIFDKFPEVQFYDYSKHSYRTRKDLPDNYHLTFSYSESPHASKWSSEWYARGVNTAVVFSGGLPSTWRIPGTDIELPVINGDESDLRFTDPKGVIVGLKTKGFARKAEVGPGHFVQEGRVAA
jgi:hypothetical protein